MKTLYYLEKYKSLITERDIHGSGFPAFEYTRSSTAYIFIYAIHFYLTYHYRYTLRSKDILKIVTGKMFSNILLQ